MFRRDTGFAGVWAFLTHSLKIVGSRGTGENTEGVLVEIGRGASVTGDVGGALVTVSNTVGSFVLAGNEGVGICKGVFIRRA